MKTSCPLMWLVICTAPSMFGDTTPSCNGPSCQLWHKCRRENQCLKCGKEMDNGKCPECEPKPTTKLCPDCGGDGFNHRDSYRCKTCNGNGVVTIPPNERS